MKRDEFPINRRLSTSRVDKSQIRADQQLAPLFVGPGDGTGGGESDVVESGVETVGRVEEEVFFVDVGYRGGFDGGSVYVFAVEEVDGVSDFLDSVGGYFLQDEGGVFSGPETVVAGAA